MENLLTSLAYFDAVHDFKQLARNHKNTIKESLPGQLVVEFTDEFDALDIASTYADDIQYIDFDTTPEIIFSQLGGSETIPIAIVCDASFCSCMINKLKTNTVGDVYFIVNRETILDPGNNMIHTDSRKFYIATDIDIDTIYYPKYVRPENNFIHSFYELHSKFDVEIENIDRSITFTTLLENNIIEQIEESEIDNSVNNIKNLINSTENADIINSCFLRKRAGDWLQVLSCLDKNRKYLINGNIKNLTGCKIYFCSSDQTALAFALYSGVNCLLKRTDGYFMYKAKEIEIPNSIKNSRTDAFNYYRDEKLEETRAILIEGLEEYHKLKSEWETILNTVDSINDFNRLKEVLLLAFHYCTLHLKFGSIGKIEMIQLFLRNPYDPIFVHEIEGYSAKGVINDSCKNYPTMIRRFRHLNPYVTSIKEEYYNLFRFENSSFESLDMIYGCTLFNHLYQRSKYNEIIKSFIIKIMNRMIEMTEYDETIVALYTLFMDVNNLEIQIGGGTDNRSSIPIAQDKLVKIGEYLTKYLLLDKDFGHFVLADDIPYVFSGASIGKKIVEHLIYKFNIIPRDYIRYVTIANEEYEEQGDKGPYYEIKEFLKRQIRYCKFRRNRLNTCKKYSNRINRIYRKNTIRMIKTRRRIKH